ncbi:hypothetical protein GOC54_22290, partial [Sinorhizobium meliloti]|nr:hypothetical protein [Sinorhizobium meliloti]MDW9571514.1 hypothetical protein [Sinorhizobium meliloti]MDW9576261.1 hypothetical protein [Sinorhizobium meliloti]MDX0166602.1 hypothetical protein [Sinorhizobium meliloti]MDX0284711.1 hypothetical protein [Sinorhizobium meliloti]
ENTFDYLHATKAYLQQWGKPIAFYSDKHGIFRTTHASKKDRTSGLTALAACTWLQMSLSFVASAVACACVLAPSFLRALFIWKFTFA